MYGTFSYHVIFTITTTTTTTLTIVLFLTWSPHLILAARMALFKLCHPIFHSCKKSNASAGIIIVTFVSSKTKRYSKDYPI